MFGELEFGGLILEISFLIALFLFGMLIYTYWRRSWSQWQIKKKQRAIREKWLKLYSDYDTPNEQITCLAIVLRRVTTQIYGHQACGGLTGEKWLTWLTKYDPQGFDWNKSGRILIELHDLPEKNSITNEQVEILYKAVQVWIKVD